MRNRYALVLALAVLLAGCGGDDPQALVASAKEYIAKREFAASIIELKTALQQDPGNAEARYLLGLTSLEAGDVVTAEVELGKARELGYGGEELQVALARTLLAKGEAAKVVAEFGATKLSSPRHQAELRAVIGNAQLAQSKPEEAKNAFNEALAIDPGNAAANLGLARLAASQRDLAGADKRVATALETMPKSAEALLLKADLLAVQGNNAAAEKAYREAVAVQTNPIPARLALIAHLLRTQALDKASVEVAALEEAAPRDPRTSYAKALLFSAQREFARARESIQQVLKVAPTHLPSLMIAGRAAFEMRAYAEAESHFRKVLQNAPNAIGAKRLLAVTHLRMGQSALALSEAKELLAATGDDPSIVALAAEAYLANGDVAAASREFEKAKRLAPDNASVQTRLALVRLATGEGERGLKELEAAAASQPDDYQADLALIAAHLRQRQPDKALKAIDALEKKQPNNPLTHNLRGLALGLKRDFSGARASFERALRLNASYMPAVANLARLDLRENKPDAARKRYEAVLAKEPNNEQALSGLAAVLRISGAPQEETEKLLMRAIAVNPSSPRARFALVNFHLRNREVSKALAAAQEAQVAIPNNPGIAQALGTVQLAAGDTRQAIATFTRVAEMAPKSPQPLVQLARAQMAAKQPDEALKSLRAALALKPDLDTVQRDIAGIYVATGRYDQAVAEARAVQKREPEQPFGYALEAEIYLAQKKLPQAEQTYLAALKRFDLPALAMRTHAVMTAAGKRAEADAMADKWVRAHPKDATVLGYLGDRAIASKDYRNAATRYKAALERQPENALFLNNLAWVSNALKEPKALEYAERAHELAPLHPGIMDTLGVILVERGETERGLELLDRASDLAPTNNDIRLNFAKALIKAGRKGAARKELEALSKLDGKLPVQQEAAALLGKL
ncbi:MAG TPA: XrtA/PEP-CTERM system TPR-repeat protein PrsT [Burkholderiales bacterium]|nr:XrtA/PEP-CTERM system TPR-repeat protein PrsT [Burkholderiales bacterium]